MAANVSKAEYWKNRGNKFFRQKKYRDAMQSYSKGLKLEPQNVNLLSNRGQVYIILGHFFRALEDTEKVLEINPNHTKGTYRKAKALAGLKRYKNAIELLKNHRSQKVFLDIVKNLTLLEHQSKTGEYDFLKLFQCETKFHIEFADYSGPVKVAKIPGKGRGLVATEDIRAGQLLIASKAFAIYYPNNNEISISNELVQLIKEKLILEPELGKEVYQLYAGPAFTEEMNNDTIVDTERIGAICSYNGFAREKDSNFPNLEKQVGLWILPSYINHSCWNSNCTWMVFNDIMLIRSFKTISEGDEILIPYIVATTPYEERETIFKIKYKFVCYCQLCEIDRNEPEEIRDDRKKILKQIEYCQEGEQFDKLLTKLGSLRPQLNVSVINPLAFICTYYGRCGKFKKSADLFIKAYNILKNSPLTTMRVQCAFDIVGCFMLAKAFKQFRKWSKILKRDAIIDYGSIDILKVICQGALPEMELYGFTLD